jgi:hypothetical protein
MIHKDLDYYKCPNCGGEYWPPEEKPITTKQIMECLAEDRKRGAKGGGSKSSRVRKKPPKKPIKPYMLD